MNLCVPGGLQLWNTNLPALPEPLLFWKHSSSPAAYRDTIQNERCIHCKVFKWEYGVVEKSLIANRKHRDTAEKRGQGSPLWKE